MDSESLKIPYYFENNLIFMFSPPFPRGHNCQFGQNFLWGLNVIPLILLQENVLCWKALIFKAALSPTYHVVLGFPSSSKHWLWNGASCESLKRARARLSIRGNKVLNCNTVLNLTVVCWWAWRDRMLLLWQQFYHREAVLAHLVIPQHFSCR